MEFYGGLTIIWFIMAILIFAYALARDIQKFLIHYRTRARIAPGKG